MRRRKRIQAKERSPRLSFHPSFSSSTSFRETLTLAYCFCARARQILPVVTFAVRRGGGPHAPSPEDPPKLAYIPLCGVHTPQMKASSRVQTLTLNPTVNTSQQHSLVNNIGQAVSAVRTTLQPRIPPARHLFSQVSSLLWSIEPTRFDLALSSPLSPNIRQRPE